MKLFKVITLVCLSVFTVLAVDSLVPIDTIINNINAVATASQGVKASDLGSLLLIAAIVNLLMNLMKFKPIAVYLNSEKLKNIKPYIAVILGIVASTVNSIINGGNITTAIITGIISGISAIGIHEATHAAVLEDMFIKLNNTIRPISTAKNIIKASSNVGISTPEA